MNNKAFTLIELIVIILVIGILTAFVISSLSPAHDSANDAKRKTDISNLYTSILARGTSESFYSSITSNIKEGETNSELQTYIITFALIH